MPRTPDPQLEELVRKAVLRLLDAGGPRATTMRAVAREAGTTTPTVYERFRDRQALMQAVREHAELELMQSVVPADAVHGLVKRSVDFCVQYPHRFELIAETFGLRFAAGRRPHHELLKERLTQEAGVDGIEREQLALAIAALILGTARGMIAVGSTTPAARELHAKCLGAVRLLIATFSVPGSDIPSHD